MTFFKEMLAYLIPFLSITVSYVFGRLESKSSAKQEMRMKRYQQFYVPFIRSFYVGFSWSNPWSLRSPEELNNLFELVMRNLEYLDPDSLKLIPEFYRSFLVLRETKAGNYEDENAYRNFDNVLNELTKRVLAESKKLGKALHLPPLGKVASDVYLKYESVKPQVPA